MKHALEVWRDEYIDGVEREVERKTEKRKALEIARHLKDLGRMSVDEIAEATNLTVDDVLRL